MLRVLLYLAMALCVHSASAVTFLVTTNADSGPGSLRQAILDANATPGPDSIHFRIASGPQTIQVATGLPIITDTIDIDGTTQPGYSNAPLIEVSGSNVTGSSSGLALRCREASIIALIINRFPGPGIWIAGQGNNFIARNYIGTDRSGTIALPNQSGIVLSNSFENQIGFSDATSRNIISGNDTYGIVFSHGSSNVVEGNHIGTDRDGSFAVPNRLDGIFFENFADSNTIGGQTAGAGNLISGNRGNGIRSAISFSNVIEGNRIGTDAFGTSAIPNGLCGINGGIDFTIGGASSRSRNLISGNSVHGIEVRNVDNVIQGNFIGTDASGTSALGNGGAGILVLSEGTLIGGVEARVGNLISGNAASGIWIVNASDTIVQGNLIGTDHSGDAALPNGSHGILLFESSDNLVGGTEPASRNVISGNSHQGIEVTGGNIIDNVIQNNYIGVNLAGAAAIGNAGFGITVASRATTIGGSEAGAANVISGNRAGGVSFGLSAATNALHGNFIGTDVSGRIAIPNLGPGVLLTSSARYNFIGGTIPGEDNLIAFNTGDGVLVESNAMSNLVQGNSIHSNSKLGINLKRPSEANGLVTANDMGDGDTRPNNLQNFPVITNVVYLASSTIIQGYLRSSTNGSFSIDFSPTPPLNNRVMAKANSIWETRTLIQTQTVSLNLPSSPLMHFRTNSSQLPP